MRAMIASGCVPSTIVGRMRCEHRRLERALLARQQRVDREEPGDRLDVVLDVDAPGHRRHAELNREQEDEQQSPPEDRHRIAGERDAHDAVVEQRVASHGGDDAGGYAENQREQYGAERELDRRGKQRHELVQHRRLRDHRLAEVAVQHAADVDAVLHQHRPVESVFLEQLRVPRRIDPALPCHRLDRITRHQADQEEREQRHADEGRDDERQPGEEETDHGWPRILSA